LHDKWKEKTTKYIIEKNIINQMYRNRNRDIDLKIEYYSFSYFYKINIGILKNV